MGKTPAPTAIFLHIPKTAGSTMTGILNRLYAGQNRYSIIADSQVDALKALPEAERAQIDLLQGHFPYGIHKYLPRSGVYFTILREPVDRIISLYYYLPRDPGNYLYEKVVLGKLSLEEFVQRDLTPATRNFQTAALAGMERWEDFHTINEDTLERAKYNLRNKIAAFGLTERFDETLLLFNRQFRWGFRSGFFDYSKRNVTAERPAKDHIPEHIRDLIREKNAYDIKLYAYADRKSVV